jgi:hypothetical protein
VLPPVPLWYRTAHGLGLVGKHCLPWRQASESANDEPSCHAPNSRSGEREFKLTMQSELGALTKSVKIFGVRSFYKHLFIKELRLGTHMIDVLPRGEKPTGAAAAAAVLHNVTLQVAGQAFL